MRGSWYCPVPVLPSPPLSPAAAQSQVRHRCEHHPDPFFPVATPSLAGLGPSAPQAGPFLPSGPRPCHAPPQATSCSGIISARKEGPTSPAPVQSHLCAPEAYASLSS